MLFRVGNAPVAWFIPESIGSDSMSIVDSGPKSMAGNSTGEN